MSAVLQKTTVPASPSTSAMSVRERLVHPRFAGLMAREARLAAPMGRTCTDSITLLLHCVRTRPAEEVRLRLESFDARLILSGRVVHFVPDTSSEGERRRETVTAGVPLLCTPLSQTRSAVSLRWHSAPSRAGPIRSRGFSSSVAAAGFPPTAPSPFGLVSVHGSNPSAYTPSSKPLPPARFTRPKCVTVPPKFNHPCQSRKDHHLSPRPPYRPAPAAPVGLPAHSPEDRKHSRASATRFISIVFRFGILVTAINML